MGSEDKFFGIKQVRLQQARVDCKSKNKQQWGHDECPLMDKQGALYKKK
jgi:hypothetical protein